MLIPAIKPFLKANIRCSKYQIFGGPRWVSYGQRVKDIVVGVSYSVEGLGMAMLKLPSTTESRAKPW